MICVLVDLLVFKQNLLMHLEERVPLLKSLAFVGIADALRRRRAQNIHDQRICPLRRLRLLPQPSGPASKAPQRSLQIFWAKTAADKDDGAVFGLIFLRG